MAKKKSPPAAPAIAGKISPGGGKETPEESFGKNLVKRRSAEWREKHVMWQWLQDSYEGGDRYRQAEYGSDRRGRPVRNLLRHRSESPDPLMNPSALNGLVNAQTREPINSIEGSFGMAPGQAGAAPGAVANDDDYEMRRSRTAIPEFTSEVVSIWLAKIYDQEIKREGPKVLMDWWKDVDGKGTPVDEYMQGTLAPQLVVNATMDMVLDRPPLAPGQSPPETLSGEKEMRLDRCVMDYILPQNMVWAVRDYAGNYLQCLVREWHDGDNSDSSNANTKTAAEQQTACVRYRHWTEAEWKLYSADGSDVLDRGDVPYIPIVRLIDQPIFRKRTIGKSRCERIAGLQFVYYNVDSEMIVSNVTQAHAVLSGPESYCKGDSSVPVGPGNILPMKPLVRNGETIGHEHWAFISPDKDPFLSLRQYCLDLIDQKDTSACLTKPAGVTGTSANAVSQSGASKTIDANTGDKLLTSLAKMLQKSERIVAEWALRCLLVRPLTQPERDSIKITYPGRFQLFSAAELCDMASKVQNVAASAGDLPLTIGQFLMAIIKAAFPGMQDLAYEDLEEEVTEFLKTVSGKKDKEHELDEAAMDSAHQTLKSGGSDSAAATPGKSSVNPAMQFLK